LGTEQVDHPKDPHDRLYTRESLVVEAWQPSREYICLSLLHAIGYTGGYLGAIPSQGWLGSPCAGSVGGDTVAGSSPKSADSLACRFYQLYADLRHWPRR